VDFHSNRISGSLGLIRRLLSLFSSGAGTLPPKLMPLGAALLLGNNAISGTVQSDCWSMGMASAMWRSNCFSVHVQHAEPHPECCFNHDYSHYWSAFWLYCVLLWSAENSGSTGLLFLNDHAFFMFNSVQALWNNSEFWSAQNLAHSTLV
jgi:hypothetical protein